MRNSWFMWLTAGIFYLYEFIHRVTPNVMVAELMRDFSISAATLGVISACYFYAYAAAQIPVGILLDKYGTRKLLTFAAIMIGTGSLSFSMTTNYIVASISRLLIGFGSAFSFVACLKIAATMFPAKRTALIVGLTNLLGVSGAIIGGRPFAALVDTISWQKSIMTLSMMGFVIACAIFIIFRNEKPPVDRHEYSFSKLLTTLKNPQVWLIAVIGGLMVAPIASYSELWGVKFLTDNYGISKAIAAEISSITFLGIAVGGPIIGWISDHTQNRKKPLFIGCTLAVISAYLIINFKFHNLILLSAAHFMLGATSSSMLLCFTLNTRCTQNNLRGSIIAFTNTMIMSISVCFQPVAGLILDITAEYDAAFTPLIACQILALILISFIYERN